MGKYHIELAIDWGTWSWVAAYVLCRDEQHVTPVYPLRISDLAYEVRMMATWVDGRLVQGFELEALANKERQISDKVIDLFKLPLYRDSETAVISERVQTQLQELPGNKTLDMLITDHLKAVIEKIKEAIRRSDEQIKFPQGAECDLEELLANLRLRLTVPEIWTPDARWRMVRAAKHAGIHIVTRAAEAECSVAYLLSKCNERKIDNHFVHGCRITTTDIGAGTNDVATHEVVKTSKGAIKLRSIDRSTGGLCGSFKVDELLYKALFKRMGGRDWLTRCSEKLKVTERDFENRALAALEQAKRDFGANDYIPVSFIRGIGGTYEHFQLTVEEMHCALDEIIGRVTDVIDRHVEEYKSNILQVTGGFSKSAYLMRKLREKYGAKGIVVLRPNETDVGECFPVAKGALLHYDSISPQNLPTQFGYALVQREYFDETIHKDSCEIIVDDEDSTKWKTLKKPWVVASPYAPDVDVVDDRIINILEQGDAPKRGEERSKHYYQEFFLPMVSPTISTTLVYLTKQFDDHAMAKVPVKNDSDEYVWRKGVKPFATIEVPIKPHLLEKEEFEVVEVDGEKHWKVYAKVVLRWTGRDVQVLFDVLKPVKFCADADDTDAFKTEVAFRVADYAWEENCSHLWDGVGSK